MHLQSSRSVFLIGSGRIEILENVGRDFLTCEALSERRQQKLDSRIQSLLFSMDSARDVGDRKTLVVDHPDDGAVLVRKLTERVAQRRLRHGELIITFVGKNSRIRAPG